MLLFDILAYFSVNFCANIVKKFRLSPPSVHQNEITAAEYEFHSQKFCNLQGVSNPGYLTYKEKGSASVEIHKSEEHSKTDCYNLNGIKLQGVTAKDVYIRNGKKYFAWGLFLNILDFVLRFA